MEELARLMAMRLCSLCLIAKESPLSLSAKDRQILPTIAPRNQDLRTHFHFPSFFPFSSLTLTLSLYLYLSLSLSQLAGLLVLSKAMNE